MCHVEEYVYETSNVYETRFFIHKKNIFPERVRFVGFILMCMYMKLFMCHIEEYVYDCGEARG